MPISEVNISQPQSFLAADQMLNIIGKHFELEPINGKKHKSDGPAKIFKVKGGRGEIGLLILSAIIFVPPANRMRLTADGKLRVCLLKEARNLI